MSENTVSTDIVPNDIKSISESTESLVSTDSTTTAAKPAPVSKLKPPSKIARPTGLPKPLNTKPTVVTSTPAKPQQQHVPTPIHPPPTPQIIMPLSIIFSLYCVSVVLSLPIFDPVQQIILELRKNSIGKPNPAVGERVSNYSRDSNIRPEELGTYYQGDILHIPDKKRNGITNLNARWPGGVVPYVINGYYTAADIRIINDAFNQYRVNTCIRFVPRTNQVNYISIESARTGCWSYIGRTGGKQIVNLQNPGCVWIDTVVHELMHAVGFAHEQSRTDRSQFIRILYGNIIPGTERNFGMMTNTNPYGVGYDYKSIMHYSNKAFSKNGFDTIVSRPPGIQFSNRFGLTASDRLKIRSLYGCK